MRHRGVRELSADCTDDTDLKTEEPTLLICVHLRNLRMLLDYFFSTHTFLYATGSPWSWSWNGPGMASSFWPPGHSLGNSTSSWILTPLWRIVVRPFLV